LPPNHPQNPIASTVASEIASAVAPPLPRSLITFLNRAPPVPLVIYATGHPSINIDLPVLERYSNFSISREATTVAQLPSPLSPPHTATTPIDSKAVPISRTLPSLSHRIARLSSKYTSRPKRGTREALPRRGTTAAVATAA